MLSLHKRWVWLCKWLIWMAFGLSCLLLSFRPYTTQESSAHPTSRKNVSHPLLYTTAQQIMRRMMEQESRRDATCWTTVRMMEHFYARRQLTEYASFLKIEVSKVLLYQIWRAASQHTSASLLSQREIDAVLPASLRQPMALLLTSSGHAMPSSLVTRLRHYHQVTENWRHLLAIAMESMVGEGLFARGFVDIKPLQLGAALRLAHLSTSLTIRLLSKAGSISSKRHHSRIEFEDIRESYQQLWRELQQEGLGRSPGRHVFSVPIQDKSMGYKLVRDMTTQNMKQKIAALRSWNQRVWQGKNDKQQLLSLLNRLSPVRLAPDTLPYLLDIFRVGLGALAIGIEEKPSSTLVASLSRSYITSPTRLQWLDHKKRLYLHLNWVTRRLEEHFVHRTLVNGDVVLSYGMMTPKGPTFKKKTLLGPDLDAIRDVTIHWTILQYIWKTLPQAKALDPFAAELLAERISEFVLFYLHLAQDVLTPAKHRVLTRKDLEAVTQIAFGIRFVRPIPEQFRWGQTLQSRKQKLMAGYPGPLFAKLPAQHGISHATCDARKDHLHLGKYAFVQDQSFHYIPEKHGTFVDRSDAAQKALRSQAKDDLYPGIQIWNGAGIAIGDFDNDGRIDVFFPGEGCNRLYRNLGNYRFEDVTQTMGIHDPHYDSHHALFVDVNNDGRLDLFVVHAKHPSKLFIQLEHGRFVDATQASGIKTTKGANTAVFFDYNNDGKLDLYVGYFGAQLFSARQLPSIDGRNGRSHQLYRNVGNGRFEEVTAASGMKSTGWAMALAALDFNQDGHLDLFIANDFGPDELYLNQGNGTFQEVAALWGVNDRTNGMNASYTDINHDGRWDLYVSVIDMFSKELRFILPKPQDLVNINEHILRSAFFLSGNQFYVSDPKIRDLYHSREQIHFEPGWRGWSWAAIFFDYENDGDEDFYLTNGWAPHSYAHNQPNQFFIRDGKRFFLYEKPTPITYRGNSRSAVAVDLSGTGKLDLVVSDFQSHPKIFRNLQPDTNAWLKVALRGQQNNFFGVGATIRLYVKGLPVQMRQVSVGSNYMSQDPLTVTFGLGKAKQAEQIEVWWPGGKKQRVQGPFPTKQTVIVRETPH